jgi:hypothetical protein
MHVPYGAFFINKEFEFVITNLNKNEIVNSFNHKKIIYVGTTCKYVKN